MSLELEFSVWVWVGFWQHNVRRHKEYVHYGGKEFTCKTCETKCKLKVNLRRHKESGHRGNTFTCKT